MGLGLCILLGLILFFCNTPSGTTYTGWDNTHPEYNLYNLTIRYLNGAWAAYQGTGAPAAQSQLAELPRIPFILLLYILLPVTYVRYAYFFLLVILGMCFMYFFLHHFFQKILCEKEVNPIFPTVGALFYTLNIVSIQQFFINFEMYAVLFAFYPLVLLSIDTYISKPTRRNFLFVLFSQFLFIPVGFVPTVAYIGFAYMCIYTFFSAHALSSSFIVGIKKMIQIALIIVVIHVYWIIPNIHYALHASSAVEKSRSNQLFVQEITYSVVDAGTFTNFLRHTHYLFTWKNFDFGTHTFVYIFKDWIQFFNSGNGWEVLSIITFSVFIGLILFMRRCNPVKWGIFIPFFIAFIFIWNGFLHLEFIMAAVSKIGVLREALRNPFTKFSNYYSFYYSIFFIYFVWYISSLTRFIRKDGLRFLSECIIVGLSAIAILYTSLPVYTGNFLNPKLKVTVPQEYAQLSKFMSNKSSYARTLLLPFFSESGWAYYDWSHLKKGNGYQGMDFLMFTLTQPLLTPDHARWSESTDSFYHELRHALNSNSAIMFRNALLKYRVSYIVLDESAINPANQYYEFNTLRNLLANANFHPVWNSNFIHVYENTQNETSIDESLFSDSDVQNVESQPERIRLDQAYNRFGNYYSNADENSFIFPFAGTLRLNNEYESLPNGVAINRIIEPGTYELFIPDELIDSPRNSVVSVSYFENNVSLKFPTLQLLLDNKTLYDFPKRIDTSAPIDYDLRAVAISIGGKSIILKQGEQKTLNYRDDSLSKPLPIYIGKQNVDLDENVFIYDEPTMIDSQYFDNHTATGVISSESPMHLKLKSIFVPQYITNESLFKCTHVCDGDTTNTNASLSNNQVVLESDRYGVMCTSVKFDKYTTDYDSIVSFNHTNDVGRSIKLFVDYVGPNTILEPLATNKQNANPHINLLRISDESDDQIVFNFETRSYGYKAKNAISNLRADYLPIQDISSLYIQKVATDKGLHRCEISNRKSMYPFFHSAEYNCTQENGYIGLNQAYDMFWIAFDSDFSLLPHIKINSWANGWIIQKQSGHIHVVYLLQPVVYLCLVFGGLLLIKIYRKHTP